MAALAVMAFWMYFGRRLGWFLSKVLLYPAPLFIGILFCLAWGVFFAFVTRWIIEWRHVGIIIKVILYGAGAYVAIPNYGLFDESSIPPEHLRKHLTIQAVPTVAYIAASVVFAFWVSIPH
jgi:hypothetical protein